MRSENEELEGEGHCTGEWESVGKEAKVLSRWQILGVSKLTEK